MSKSLYLVIFVAAIALAYASSQTGGVANSVPDQKGEPQSTNAAQASQSNQTNNGSQQQNNSPTSVPGGATDASGGGVVGSAGSSMGKTQVPVTPETPSAAAAIPDNDLQTQIQNALTKEPTLSGDTVNTKVSAESVEITGNVATAREKQTATRIVQSYAGNKKIVSHLAITGRERNAAPGTSNEKPASASERPDRPPR